jgi:hypothetical protein
MPRAFWIQPFLNMASSVWSMPEEEWIDDYPNKGDIEMLANHARLTSTIDQGNFRSEMYQKWKAKDASVELMVRTLTTRARVVFLGTREQWSNIPWKFWARVFQSIGHPIERVLFYADPSMRSDPPPNEALTAKAINGGYTYMGSKEVIVIYRYEEATRVLLHELLHTAGFDAEKSVELLEAHTEAWTELFLCALLSRGKYTVFHRLWKAQVDWMTEQTESLKVSHNINTPADYAWRYMLGKKDVLENAGFLEYFKGKGGQPTPSLRFTTPLWDTYMV